MKGRAKPKPMSKKKIISSGEERRTATSSAGPMKGPMQLKPIRKAKMPPKNEPA